MTVQKLWSNNYAKNVAQSDGAVEYTDWIPP